MRVLTRSRTTREDSVGDRRRLHGHSSGGVTGQERRTEARLRREELCHVHILVGAGDGTVHHDKASNYYSTVRAGICEVGDSEV